MRKLFIILLVLSFSTLAHAQRTMDKMTSEGRYVAYKGKLSQADIRISLFDNTIHIGDSVYHITFKEHFRDKGYWNFYLITPGSVKYTMCWTYKYSNFILKRENWVIKRKPLELKP